MKMTDAIEEILESLWVLQEEEGKRDIKLSEISQGNNEEAVRTLQKEGFISVEDGRIRLLEKGKEQAKNMVRRHRLGERLLVDVLQLRAEIVHKTACKFEHLLQPEVEESVCTLLGHPKICPHGKPIPPGECCIQSRWIVEARIRPLSSLRPGQKGKIAYLITSRVKRLHKLMVMGILPGSRIELLQRNPSFVFQIGHTQIAVDQEMAECIYVRLEK